MFRLMHVFFNDLFPFGTLAPDSMVCFAYLMISYDIYCNNEGLPYTDLDGETLINFLIFCFRNWSIIWAHVHKIDKNLLYLYVSAFCLIKKIIEWSKIEPKTFLF